MITRHSLAGSWWGRQLTADWLLVQAAPFALRAQGAGDVALRVSLRAPKLGASTWLQCWCSRWRTGEEHLLIST